jgi:hypothetical protein
MVRIIHYPILFALAGLVFGLFAYAPATTPQPAKYPIVEDAKHKAYTEKV